MQSSIYNTKTWTDKFIHREPANPFDEERVNKILDIIPEDIGAVLDVGIGGGYIYRKLKERNSLRCFGIDISLEMVKKSGTGTACVSDVSNLPFNSEEFDLVLATDLIEHIKADSFKESVSEIVRVAKKYILVNSPYKESIDWPVSICARCGKEFNIYGHLRRVDTKLIKGLFPEREFEVLKMGTLGRKRNLRPGLLVYAARKWGRVYSKEAAICPYCFNSPVGHPRRNIIEKSFGKAVCSIFLLMDKLTPPVFKSRSEMYILLRKKNAV